MEYKALGNNVLVKAIDGGKVTDSGILLQVSIEPDRGSVISVGDQVKEVSVGDQVFMDWNRATKIDGEEIWCISEDNIVWIYE